MKLKLAVLAGHCLLNSLIYELAISTFDHFPNGLVIYLEFYTFPEREHMTGSNNVGFPTMIILE